MEMDAQIVVIDFGSQYTQLIARRLRELGVFSEIHSPHNLPEWPSKLRGIILSGGPQSACSRDELSISLSDLPSVPVLGICYGAQLIVTELGGQVEPHQSRREYGKAMLHLREPRSYLLEGVFNPTQVWMSHGDTITRLPNSLDNTAYSDQIHCAAFESKCKQWLGLQFHPEVVHSSEGQQMLLNFVSHCACTRSWSAAGFVETQVLALSKQIGAKEQVIMAISGGVDSSVAAQLLQKAIGDRLICVFIDNGLLRKNEYKEVLSTYTGLGMNILAKNSSDRFYKELVGLRDPEEKRRAIGRTFVDVFSEVARDYPQVKWLAQGTIYPDRIESYSVSGPSQTIKSHHNVGGLPEKLPFRLVEPLSMLFKDEVRKVGQALGLPSKLLQRHPFPGPGLGIRIMGEVSTDKVKILREADAIFIEALKREKLYEKVWQAAAILLPVQSVGVQGDQRSYAHVLALRAVCSEDGMTAEAAHLPHTFLEEVATEITNRVPAVNRVVYDISSKPPATIEWE